MDGAGVSLGYRTDLHIFKRCWVTTVRYRNDVLELTVRFYAAGVRYTFVLMDGNSRRHRATIVDVNLENERIVCMGGQYISLNLIPLKIFEMLLVVLYLHVSHFQTLLLS